MAGAASRTQELVREIAMTNYNNSVNGLSGVRIRSIRTKKDRLMFFHYFEERGLWPNECLVSILSAWLLSSKSCFWGIHHWLVSSVASLCCIDP